MIGLLAMTAMLLTQQPADDLMFVIREPNGKPARLMYKVNVNRLEPPKLSPKKFGDPPVQWQFDWLCAAYGPDTTGLTQNKELVVRVYSQEHKAEGDKAPLVCRMALRLWDMNATRLRVIHNASINHGIVDFYLCWGGKAGGEQLREQDVSVDGNPFMVNSIYLYDLKSFDGPVEMAREVAHEYGHAVLPAVGGFEKPEDWANGYLGEKLYLRWLRDEIAAGRMYPDDVMGASAAQLDGWVKSNVDPLVLRAAQAPPNKVFLNDKGKGPMDAYLGLALYAESIFPSSVFARSMKLIGSSKAGDYPASLVLAASEPERITLRIPPLLKGQSIWIPLGTSKITGANVLKRQGDWAQIQPTIGAVVIKPVR
jgi:hypothetical protein